MVGRVDASSQWRQCISKCLAQRIAVDRFASFARLLQKTSYLSGRDLAQLLVIRPRLAAIDSLLWEYIRRLIDLDFIDGDHLLDTALESDVVLSSFSDGIGPTTEGAYHFQNVSTDVKEGILNLLCKLYAGTQKPKTSGETEKTLAAISKWIFILIESQQQAMLETVGLHYLDSHDLMLYEGLALLVLTLAQNEQVRGILDSGLPKETADRFSDALSKLAILLTNASPVWANRLEFLQNSYQCLQHREVPFEALVADTADLREMELHNLGDPQVVRTRAFLTFYLDSLLHGIPNTNTQDMLHFLQMRYNRENGMLIVDLVTSTFDLLLYATNRGESSSNTFAIRSFLVNKLPMLINAVIAISAMSFPLDIAFLLSDAFLRFDPTIYNSFIEGNALTPSTNLLLSEARRDFISSCLLHGLISQAHVPQLLGGDQHRTLSRPVRIQKAALLAGSYTDSSQLDQIIRGMESLDGNAGVHAEAMGQIIQKLCATPDTMALKSVCHVLAPRGKALDALFLFNDCRTLLDPLCTLIDEWKYDDDQVECQPNYNEFSACLTLLLAIVKRFGLTTQDLGLKSDESFLRWFLQWGVSSIPSSSLTSDREKYLADWARGLFEDDGIGDDLLSKFPPHEYYRIVPTLFGQIVSGCQAKLMSFEKVRSGLELLLQTIVVPSIFLGFRYLIDRVWRNEREIDVVLKIMEVLIIPTSTPGEAQSMHFALLSATAHELDRFLRDIKQAQPDRQDIEPLLQELVKHADYCRTLTRISHQPTTIWEEASLLQQLGDSFNSLCHWSMPNLMGQLPLYSHSNLVITVRRCHAVRVVRLLIDLLVNSMQSGMRDVALDIATAVICSWETHNNTFGNNSPQPFMTLRQALTEEYSNAKDIIATDTVRAQNIVFLHRRVTTQLSPLSGDLMPMQNGLDDLQLSSTNMGDLSSGSGLGIGVGGQGEQLIDFNSTADGAFDLVMDTHFADGDMAMYGTDAGTGAESTFQLQADGTGFLGQDSASQQQQQQQQQQKEEQGDAGIFGEHDFSEQTEGFGIGTEEIAEDDFWSTMGF